MIPHKKLVKDVLNAALTSKEELAPVTQELGTKSKDMGTAFGQFASVLALGSILMRRYVPEEQYPVKGVRSVHTFFYKGSLRSLQAAGAFTLLSMAAALGFNATNAVNKSQDESTFSNNFPTPRS